MRVLFINEVCGHTSTGKICCELAEEMEKEGDIVRIAYGRDGYVPEKYLKFAKRIGNDLDVRMHALYTRFFDKHGLGSVKSTKRFLEWADRYNPDLLWLHNLHGYYINYVLLFEWIKSRPGMQVLWTLHDCWAFTGHCSHFSFVKCDRWKYGCCGCPQKKEYPKSILLDDSKRNYLIKKKAFSNVPNMKILTPSLWLSEQVKESFLKNYPVEVHHNEIDKNVFKPTSSDFRGKNNLKEKTVILGVANVWNDRKGFTDYISLAKILDHKKYVIVLVGLDEKQKRLLPEGILGYSKTKDQVELAGIYSSADWFVNFTYEDTFPTVNLEAEACGTRVITYDSCGAPETVNSDKSFVIKQGDYYEVKNIIENVRA